MPDSGGWAPTRGGLGETVRVNPRPRLGIADLVLQLWRAKWLMLLVFLPIFVLGALGAFMMPTEYTARSRVFVKLGEEYVYRPRVGSEGGGLAPEQEQLIQGEMEILQSPVVAERALEAVGFERAFPEIAEDMREKIVGAPPAERDAIEFEAFRAGVATVQKSFEAAAGPKTPVIGTSFSHEDPATSAELLNAILASYISYRTEVFADEGAAGLRGQRQRFERNLQDAEDAIRQFLNANNISSFETERETAQQLYATVSGELLTNKSRMSAVQGQLSRSRTQLASIDPQQDLFVEDNSAQTLRELQIERQDLLARYTESSDPVQNIDRRIERVRTYLSSDSQPAGMTRRGPNPHYQAVETQVTNLEAEAQSLSEQRGELESQLNEIEGRLKRLNDLEPRWLELQRQRELMETNVENFAVREVEANALQQISGEGADSVRILEPARAPLKGSSLKLPVMALAFLFAGFTALMAGLLFAVTRRGFATARSLERTTGLPVIGVSGPRGSRAKHR